MCRLCDDRDETINYILKEYSKLAQRNTRTPLGGEGDPQGIVQKNKKESRKILWDFTTQTDHPIPDRRPAQILINDKKRIGLIEDFAMPPDHSVKAKENEKLYQYVNFAGNQK